MLCSLNFLQLDLCRPVGKFIHVLKKYLKYINTRTYSMKFWFLLLFFFVCLFVFKKCLNYCLPWLILSQLDTSWGHLGRGSLNWQKSLYLIDFWASLVHFLTNVFIWEVPAHSGWCHPWAVGPGFRKKKQVEQAMGSKSVCSRPVVFPWVHSVVAVMWSCQLK